MKSSAVLDDEAARVTFGPVFDGLFRHYLGALTPRAIARLHEASLDVGRPLQPGYPTEVWYLAVRVLAEEQHPGLDFPAAVREVGRAFMRGYFETPLGLTVFAVLRLLGPLRSLRRMSRNFRTGNNFSETWIHEDGPGDVRLEVNDDLADAPTFIQGLIEVGLERVCAQASSVEVLGAAGNGHTQYRVRWTP